VVVSIFVNPTQFGPEEDFAAYPRDFERDCGLLEQEQIDIVFHPALGAMYPDGAETYVEVEKLSLSLCGAMRPGHFRGVATVVAKLFQIVRPDVAVFGQKDAQQALIVRAMVRQLAFDVELRLARTVREDDGLAVSSRNLYLSANQRVQAAALFKALEAARRSLESGERNPRMVETGALDTLRGAGINRVDYAEMRNADDLSALVAVKGRVILALAAHVGTTRLIDNMVFDVRDDGVHADVMLY